MDNPANLQRADFLVVTSAGANVISAAVTAIAAPGANLRLRIWAAHLSGLTTRTGRLWADIQDTTAFSLFNMGAAVGGSDHVNIPGGYAMADDTALQVRTQSDIASQSFRLFIWYTIEPTA